MTSESSNLKPARPALAVTATAQQPVVKATMLLSCHQRCPHLRQQEHLLALLGSEHLPQFGRVWPLGLQTRMGPMSQPWGLQMLPSTRIMCHTIKLFWAVVQTAFMKLQSLIQILYHMNQAVITHQLQQQKISVHLITGTTQWNWNAYKDQTVC